MDQQKAERESMSPPASPHCMYIYYVSILISQAMIQYFMKTIKWSKRIKNEWNY